jgi:adenosylhomocysteine nucleosidase
MLRPDAGPLAIIAVANEIAAIERRVAPWTTEGSGGFTLARARLAGKDLVLVTCGMGKVNAALATQAVIERCRPAAIISCGSAGGLWPDMQPGDLIIGERVTQHDAGAYLGERFVHVGVQTWDAGRWKTRRSWPADADLVSAAQAAAGALDKIARVRAGLIAAGDQAIFSKERRAWLRETLQALAVDMESAAVAQTAAANGIAWLAIRAVSDAADEDAGFDVSKLVEYADEASATTLARRLGYLAAHPDTLAKLRRLRAGIQLAAERATALTLAVVERL